MKTMTVTEVSKMLGISARMLRYYEKIGLIKSMRVDGYAYRCYEESAVRRLHQILELRRLRLPLKEIAAIINDGDGQRVCDLMKGRLSLIEDEISALKAIKKVLEVFLSRFDGQNSVPADISDIISIIEIANTLTPPKNTLKVRTMNMNDLSKSRVIEMALGSRPLAMKKISDKNNTVYEFESHGIKYILKLYRQSDWPEEGKLPFVYRLLKENHIPCAEMIAYDKHDEDFPNGYLIERVVNGQRIGSAGLDQAVENELFLKLAEMISHIHEIRIQNYGYIGHGIADHETFSGFFEDEFDERARTLIKRNIYTADEVRKMKERFMTVIRVFDDLPSVLCHGSLSLDNVILNDDGTITLIDWDDAMAYNWMADIARMTFTIRLSHDDNRCRELREIFLSKYQTRYRKEEFPIFERAFHIYNAVDCLVFFIDTDNVEMEKRCCHLLEELR